MEVNVFNKDEYKKIEGFKLATGILCIIAALYSIYRSGFIQGFGFFMTPFLFVTTILAQITLIASMMLFAVYLFALYGKKQSKLLVIAVLIFAGNKIISAFLNIGILIYLPEYMGITLPPRLIVDFLSTAIAGILICVLFIVIAISLLKNKPRISKLMPLIALGIAIIPLLLRLFSPPVSVNLENILDFIYYIPFILFNFGCSQNHKRVALNTSNSRLLEQDMIIGDLNAQLQYLKNEYDNGRITQQEYDYKRKGLVDKL